jgi:pimeloyl-ACP methyl ester carboxylesterase
MRILSILTLIFLYGSIWGQISQKEIFTEIKGDTLWGTLTNVQKDIDTNQTLVLIIAGSGPTDRDGNNTVMKNFSLQMLGNDLAKFGFPTIRYDKRGVAQSTNAYIPESELTFNQNVLDAESFYDYAKGLGYNKIAIAGHSEGSLIGLLLANKKSAHYYISLAGAGRPISEVLKEQYENTAPIVRDSAHSIIDSLVKGVKVDTLSPWLYSIFRPQIQDYIISWMAINPADEMVKFQNSALIIQGTTDIQVAIGDAEALHAANPKSELVVIDGMNHIFKKAPEDRTLNKKTYNQPELPLHPDLVLSIVNFLKK